MIICKVVFSRLRCLFFLSVGLFSSVDTDAQGSDVTLSLETSFAAGLSQYEGLILTVGIDVEQQSAGTEADWFLIKLENGEYSSFNLDSGAFETGIFATVQQALSSIAPVSFGPISASEGELELYFGIDLKQDQIVSEESLRYVSERVQITGAITPGSCETLELGDVFCALGDREYLLHVPSSYSAIEPAGLIVDMHGYNSNAFSQKVISGFDEYADENGFIVVYPQGHNFAWATQGQCCAFVDPQDDLQFIEDLVTEIKSMAAIDTSRVFATGLSNGGAMSHTLACELPQLFTAVIPVAYQIAGGASFDQIKAGCTPAEPIPVVHFHGDSDDIAFYNGGFLDAVGARDSNDLWGEIQSCDSQLVEVQAAANTLCEVHDNCLGGAFVALCTVSGGEHNLYPDVVGKGIPGIAFDLIEQFSGN